MFTPTLAINWVPPERNLSYWSRWFSIYTRRTSLQTLLTPCLAEISAQEKTEIHEDRFLLTPKKIVTRVKKKKKKIKVNMENMRQSLLQHTETKKHHLHFQPTPPQSTCKWEERKVLMTRRYIKWGYLKKKRSRMYHPKGRLGKWEAATSLPRERAPSCCPARE